MNKYSNEVKENALNLYFSGNNISSISKTTGISRTTIYNWITEREQQYYSKEKPINLREYNNLKRKCERLSQMVEILKSADCNSSTSLAEKCEIIKAMTDKYSISLLCEALDVAIADAIAHRLTIQVDSVLHTVRLRDVQYIEIYGHYANIYTSRQTYRLRTTLKEIMGRLPKGYFVPTHKSFIVNLDHITSATTSEIKLDCGAKIPIGRTKAKEFNQALFRYLGR